MILHTLLPFLVSLAAVGLSTTAAFIFPSPSAPPTSQLSMIGNLFGNNNPTTEKVILDFPTSTLKVGPLQFFLQIYLVSEQNKPSQGAWVLNPQQDGQQLDMYYKDGTGRLSITLDADYGVQMQRHGKKPSLEYVLQESVLLHGILDELDGIANAEDIDVDKRLIKFVQEDAIDSNRSKLPARKAEE